MKGDGTPARSSALADRTRLRRCSAVQLGPSQLRVNGPSNSARRREARPHQLSQYGPRASAQVACSVFHPLLEEGV